MVVSQPLKANVTYLDATEGPIRNTFATGGSLDEVGWINADIGSSAVNNQWKKRNFAEGGTIFHSLATSADSQQELTTRITGLNEGIYDLWVFFWDAEGSNLRRARLRNTHDL